MSSNIDRNPPNNRARRHFLGVIAAMAALGTISSTSAHAMGNKTWRRSRGGNGSGSNPGGEQNCFLRGTSIMTKTGETAIEDLKIGDRVVTVRGEAVAVKWIGHQRFKKSGASWHESVEPIRVARHALDDRTPHRDLYLSPNHALYLDGVLIRVKDLVNGVSISPVNPGTDVLDFYQIVLDTHEVVLAEGAAAETHLLRNSNHEQFTNFVEYNRLYPAEQPVAMTPFAPIFGYEGGREHFKALLRMGVSPFVKMRDPIQEAYRRIAERAEELVS